MGGRAFPFKIDPLYRSYLIFFLAAPQINFHSSIKMCCSFDYVNIFKKNGAVSGVGSDFFSDWTLTQTACTMECRKVVVIPGYQLGDSISRSQGNSTISLFSQESSFCRRPKSHSCMSPLHTGWKLHFCVGEYPSKKLVSIQYAG